MRALAPGSVLNTISGSLNRYPGFQVLIWNPKTTTINEVATNKGQAPRDISDFVDSIQYSENIGYENGDDPSTTQAEFTFRRNPDAGEFRRGLIEDGVIVQIREGDLRVQRQDWLPIFTGTFRGRPGDNPGTRSGPTEGLSAKAFGREERYLNLQVTSKVFPVDTDIGTMIFSIAQRHLKLTQDEILIGAQGFPLKHLTNQIVQLPALQTLWELLFPVFKKPKFDSTGRLVAVDVRLDKPAARIFSDDDLTIEARVADPNDVEVNNNIVLRGLNADLTKIVQVTQRLLEFTVTTGYFDSEFQERKYYSADRSQRAENTFIAQRKKIRWSDATWVEVDEFHGIVTIDTRFLRDARVVIFATWLAVQLARAAIQFSIDEEPALGSLLGIIVLALDIASMVALAALLWAMNFIGRGEFEVWGDPFEFVYEELVSEAKLVGLAIEEERQIEFRNDFISNMTDLDAHAKERLKRELVKNQLFTITLMNDLLLEVDDIIELSNGDRFYILSVNKELRRAGRPTMSLVCWKVFEVKGSTAEAVSIPQEAGA